MSWLLAVQLERLRAGTKALPTLPFRSPSAQAPECLAGAAGARATVLCAALRVGCLAFVALLAARGRNLALQLPAGLQALPFTSRTLSARKWTCSWVSIWLCTLLPAGCHAELVVDWACA